MWSCRTPHACAEPPHQQEYVPILLHVTEQTHLPQSPLCPGSFASELWDAGLSQPRSSHYAAQPCGPEPGRLHLEASPQRRQITLKAKWRRNWEGRRKRWRVMWCSFITKNTQQHIWVWLQSIRHQLLPQSHHTAEKGICVSLPGWATFAT